MQFFTKKELTNAVIEASLKSHLKVVCKDQPFSYQKIESIVLLIQEAHGLRMGVELHQESQITIPNKNTKAAAKVSGVVLNTFEDFERWYNPLIKTVFPNIRALHRLSPMISAPVYILDWKVLSVDERVDLESRFDVKEL